MDYYYAAPSVAATDFIAPQSVCGEPPSHGTSFDGEFSNWIETQRKGRRSETLALAPSNDAQFEAIASGFIVEKAPSAQRSEHSGNFASDCERIARQRMRILVARLSGDTMSSELIARLEILNRKLSEAVPRVAPARVESLEKWGELVTGIERRRAERMQEFDALVGP